MAGDAQSYDLSYLNQVFQGNRALVVHIVELFLQQVPEYVRMMERNLREGKFDAIHPLAHKSKSSTSMLGLKELEIILIDIELSGKAGRYENMEEKIQLLRDKLKLCTSSLEMYLARQDN